MSKNRSAIPVPKNPDPLLTCLEAGEYLNLSENFVRKLIATGELPACRFGRAVRVRLSALQAYADHAAR